jgi:hypothetical protein
MAALCQLEDTDLTRMGIQLPGGVDREAGNSGEGMLLVAGSWVVFRACR